jgi:hypothetical protein
VRRGSRRPGDEPSIAGGDLAHSHRRTASDELSVVLDAPAEFNRGRVLLMIKAC